MSQRWITCLAAWGMVLILASPLLAQNNGGTRLRLRFSSIPDGVLVPVTVNGNAINRSRTVVGVYTTLTIPGLDQPLWAPYGQPSEPLDLPPLSIAGKATCINDWGRIGGVYLVTGTFQNLPVVWINSVPTTPALPTGAINGGVTCINNQGRIGIWINDAVFNTRTFAQDPTGPWIEMTPLGGSSPFARLNSMDDSGNAGGTSRTASGDYHACTWTQAGGVTDEGVLPGFNYSTILAQNNAGIYVGYCQNTTTSAQVPIVIPKFLGEPMAPLPAPAGGGYATGINASGLIVGVINTATGPHGALWQPGPPGTYTTYTDLNTIISNLPSGVTVTSVNGINAQGAMVGGDSTGQACVLSEPNIAPVTYLLLGQ